jgi:leucyl aminopeptidase (aminopeptidase T)
MTKIKVGVVMAAVLAAGSAGAQPAKTADIAEKIVTKTAAVKEGEIVLLSGGPGDMAFLEDLAVAVRKHGAFPIVSMWSESGERKLLDGRDPKFDDKTDAGDLALAKVINVSIVLPAVRDNSIYEKFPPERQRKIALANQAVTDTMLKRNVRVIELSNGLAPSAARAKTLGISEADLTNIFWSGLSADYGAIEDKAKSLKDTLSKGGELHITLANGTDLKMKIKGRKVLTSDGVLSPEDIKAGGASVQAWLPAGEVFLSPVPGTVEGKLVDDRMVVFEKEITGVTADIKAGKIMNITAKTGWDLVKARYDAAGPDKNAIGVFDIGINPNVKTGGKLETFIGAGTITMTTGNNTWAGGTSKEPFGFQFQMAGATVTLDGKPLIENGALK